LKVEQPARLERAINRAASKRGRFATDRYNRDGHVVTTSMRGIAATLTEDDMKKLADHYGAPAK